MKSVPIQHLHRQFVRVVFKLCQTWKSSLARLVSEIEYFGSRIVSLDGCCEEDRDDYDDKFHDN